MYFDDHPCGTELKSKGLINNGFMQQEGQFKYFAFISYSSHDQAWGKRVQRKLEHYRLPATLCSEHGWERKPMRPVFFAPTDIQPGGLTEELQGRLQASRNLIVICSPHSAQSEWVGKEIEYFHSLGRAKDIHFFIVDGIPHSGDAATECFNHVVERLGIPEILGANIHERIHRLTWMNRERAYVQLVSKLLGVEFDAIWQRHRRRMVQRIMVWSVGTLAVVFGGIYLWNANTPFDMQLHLKEAEPRNCQLPVPRDIVVNVTLDNETKSDTLTTLDNTASFANLPHCYLSEEVNIRIIADGFLPLDTSMVLSSEYTLTLQRDPHTYGNVKFRLWNVEEEKTFPGAVVNVEGHQVAADDEGYITLMIPLKEQRTRYHVTAMNPIVDDFIIMPCGPDNVIIVEKYE